MHRRARKLNEGITFQVLTRGADFLQITDNFYHTTRRNIQEATHLSSSYQDIKRKINGFYHTGPFTLYSTQTFC
jgi:hypothetical protein